MAGDRVGHGGRGAGRRGLRLQDKEVFREMPTQAWEVVTVVKHLL